MNLEKGVTISHYKILSEIGKGGMGEVYLAEDTKLDRKVALKILPKEFVEDSERMSRFVREAKSASALNHPNILTIYEINEIEGLHLISTEYIKGKTLDEYARTKALRLSAVLDIAIQVASALDEAHSAGIVHRDIKPDNIMVRPNGLVKVLDFGIAKLTATLTAGEETATAIQSQTLAGKIIGTPNYMSPEQARGKVVDARSDIFSFGIVLYEILSGRPAFEGENALDIIGAILHKEPVPLGEVVPDLPPEIISIIEGSLRKKLDERYQNVKDVLADLRRVKQRLDFEEVESSLPPATGEQETIFLDSSVSGQIVLPESAAPNNLTGEHLPLIGRVEETAEILDLLFNGGVRLLTLSGVGGTGKTRLANAIAHRSVREFSDGVFYVPLAPVADHELVIPEIAKTLGVREDGATPLIESLNAHLRNKRMLLILDNFEQVIEAAPSVGEMLTTAPDVKILVTSQIRLNLQFEREFTLQPLGVPVETQLAAKEVRAFPAVELFLRRAKAAKADFALTDENAPAVAEICRRLDGLPLAIELAAVRVKVLSPQAILTRLENSLSLLTGGAKDLPERQRTMRSAVSWSYDLLDRDEQDLLNRLSVFRGGFTLDSAESVAGSSIDILDGMSSLVDKSLIFQREQADGERRFKMLVVVREFAIEKLAESGEEDQTKARHAAFYADLTKKASPELSGADAATWLEKLEREHENLRVALEWSSRNDIETNLRLVAELQHFWLTRGHLAESLNWSKSALNIDGDQSYPRLVARISSGLSTISWKMGDRTAGVSYGQEGLRLSRATGDKGLIVVALHKLASAEFMLDKLSTSQDLIEEALPIAREINDSRQVATLSNLLGEIARTREDYETAEKHYQEMLAIARKETDKPMIVMATVNLGAVACVTGNYESSRTFALESLRISEELGDKTSIGYAFERFAALSVIGGEMKKAARLSGSMQTIYDAVGYKVEELDRIFLERYLDEARAAIGVEEFDAAYADGRAMAMTAAIALARESSEASAVTNVFRRSTGSVSGESATVEMTAEFQRTLDDAPQISGPRRKFGGWQLAGIGVVALIFVSSFFAYRYFTSDSKIRSIAVMPFANETGDPGNEYLSDGLSDSLINKLSQLPQIKVIARSSAFKYKGREIDVRSVATELGVQAVITGRMIGQGDNVQISVEMINAADSTRIWGDNYYRKVAGTLDVPEVIAQDIAQNLNLTLSGEQKQQIAKRTTVNADAYQLNLTGVFYQRSNGAANLKRAIEYQNQAIALDPNFAQAYAELAFNYGALVEISAIDPADGKPKARAAAEKAVALDESLAEAHLALAYIENQDLNWVKAEVNYKRAIELNVNYASAHTLYAAYLSQIGRFDEALAEIHQSQKLDPLRVGLIGNEGIILYYARRYAEASIKMVEGLTAEPKNAPARVYLGQVYTASGQYEKAITELQTADELDSESTSALINLGGAYALSGNREKALDILEQLRTTKRYVSPASLATLYAALGDKDSAVKSLEKAYVERDSQLQVLKVDPAYDALRDDPRFKEMLRKMGLPE